MEEVAVVIAIFCQKPPPPGMLRWSLRAITDHLNARVGELLNRTVDRSTVARVLARHCLRPHRFAYFLHVRDPYFIEKMHHILAVYARRLKNTFCVDECPQIQAISRENIDVPQPDGSVKREYFFKRHGTTDVLAFLQVCSGRVDAFCRPSHETATWIEVFRAHVAMQPSGEQLHYICDNLSPHFNVEFCKVVAEFSGRPCPPASQWSTGAKRREWLQREDKRVVVHFLPFHGSWLNQVEVWFSLLRRYALDGGWFNSVESLITTIMAFLDTWNKELAHPFDFRYNGDGLEGVLVRRFRRILLQPEETLKNQLDSKFLADISLLCVRLHDRHRAALAETDWRDFAAAVRQRGAVLEAIIAAESGPRRRPRVENAFSQLWALVAPNQPRVQPKLPETAAQ